MKFNNDYSKLYAVVSEENHMLEIDAIKLDIKKIIETGDDPEIFDIDPENKIIAVSNEDDNELTIIDMKTKKLLKVLKM